MGKKEKDKKKSKKKRDTKVSARTFDLRAADLPSRPKPLKPSDGIIDGGQLLQGTAVIGVPSNELRCILPARTPSTSQKLATLINEP